MTCLIQYIINCFVHDRFYGFITISYNVNRGSVHPLSRLKSHTPCRRPWRIKQRRCMWRTVHSKVPWGDLFWEDLFDIWYPQCLWPYFWLYIWLVSSYVGMDRFLITPTNILPWSQNPAQHTQSCGKNILKKEGETSKMPRSWPKKHYSLQNVHL